MIAVWHESEQQLEPCSAVIVDNRSLSLVEEFFSEEGDRRWLR